MGMQRQAMYGYGGGATMAQQGYGGGAAYGMGNVYAAQSGQQPVQQQSSPQQSTSQSGALRGQGMDPGSGYADPMGYGASGYRSAERTASGRMQRTFQPY